jgi:hypothetical protein
MSSTGGNPGLGAIPEVDVSRIDVARCRGVDVIILYTSTAVYVLVLGCVLMIRHSVVDVLYAGHRYEIEL